MGLVTMPKQWTPLDWVSVDAITGTGATVVESSVLALPLPTVNYADIMYEIEFIQKVLAGGDSVYSWIRHALLSTGFTATDGKVADSSYTYMFYSDAASKERIGSYSIKLKTPIMHGGFSGGRLSQYFYIRSKGGAAGTQWEVSNIRGRAIYLPL